MRSRPAYRERVTRSVRYLISGVLVGAPLLVGMLLLGIVGAGLTPCS